MCIWDRIKSEKRWCSCVTQRWARSEPSTSRVTNAISHRCLMPNTSVEPRSIPSAYQRALAAASCNQSVSPAQRPSGPKPRRPTDRDLLDFDLVLLRVEQADGALHEMASQSRQRGEV